MTRVHGLPAIVPRVVHPKFVDDDTDYCPHTAFAAALPQVRKAIRR